MRDLLISENLSSSPKKESLVLCTLVKKWGPVIEAWGQKNRFIVRKKSWFAEWRMSWKVPSKLQLVEMA